MTTGSVALPSRAPGACNRRKDQEDTEHVLLVLHEKAKGRLQKGPYFSDLGLNLPLKFAPLVEGRGLSVTSPETPAASCSSPASNDEPPSGGRGIFLPLLTQSKYAGPTRKEVRES